MVQNDHPPKRLWPFTREIPIKQKNGPVTITEPAIEAHKLEELKAAAAAKF